MWAGQMGGPTEGPRGCGCPGQRASPEPQDPEPCEGPGVTRSQGWGRQRARCPRAQEKCWADPVETESHRGCRESNLAAAAGAAGQALDSGLNRW